MNFPEEQCRTSDRKCDEAQRPLGAYRTDDFSLSHVVLALSTEMGLVDNASSQRGGQVKKYLDKSMTAYVMHTKFFVFCCVLRSSVTLILLASLSLNVSLCVYLACLSLQTSGCAQNLFCIVHRNSLMFCQ